MEISLVNKNCFLLKHKKIKVTICPQETKVEGEGESVTVTGPGEYEIQGVTIAGLKNKDKVIYLYDLEELHVAYLNELQEKLTDSQLDFLDGVDVLLASGQSADIIKQVGPSLVVTKESIKEMTGEPRKEKKLLVNKLDLPEETEVVILYG